MPRHVGIWSRLWRPARSCRAVVRTIGDSLGLSPSALPCPVGVDRLPGGPRCFLALPSFALLGLPDGFTDLSYPDEQVRLDDAQAREGGRQLVHAFDNRREWLPRLLASWTGSRGDPARGGWNVSGHRLAGGASPSGPGWRPGRSARVRTCPRVVSERGSGSGFEVKYHRVVERRVIEWLRRTDGHVSPALVGRSDPRVGSLDEE